MTIISDLGTLILKLRTQLLASPWQQDPGTGHVTHPAFDVMCNTHKAFKEYSGFLFTGNLLSLLKIVFKLIPLQGTEKQLKMINVVLRKHK